MSSYNNLQFHVCWSVLWPSLCIHCFCKAKNVLSASYTLVKFLVVWLLCNGDMQRRITPQLFRPENWSLRWHTLTDTEGIITGAGGLGLCRTKLVVFKRDYYLYTSNHFHAALEETIPFSSVSSLAPGEGAIQASLRSIRRELYVWKRGGLWSWPPAAPLISQSHFFDLEIAAILKLSLVSLSRHLLNIGEMFKVNNIFILSKQMIGLSQTKPHSAVIYSCSLYLSFLF